MDTYAYAITCAHTSTCIRDAHTQRHMHTDSCTHSTSNSTPRTPPQLFLSSDLSPPIPEAKLASSTQPKRKDSETFLFHFKEVLIHFAKGIHLGKCLGRGKLTGGLSHFLNSCLNHLVHLPTMNDTLAPNIPKGLFNSYSSFGSVILWPYNNLRR